MHVHIMSGDGEAKFWIEPEVELAVNHGYNRSEIKQLQKIVEEREDEIRSSWNKHFGA